MIFKFKKAVAVSTPRASVTQELMMSSQTLFMGKNSTLLPFCHKLRMQPIQKGIFAVSGRLLG